MRGVCIVDPSEQLDVILPTVSDLVDRIDPEDLHHPTPCAEFDLLDVLDHMIGLGGSFAYLFRGEEPPPVVVPAADGRVPAAAFRIAMTDLHAATRSEGAMTRIVATPLGEMPGETFARLVAFDGIVHGWDISRATGLDLEVPDEIVGAVDGFARDALTDDLRDGQTFKAATTPPATATALERLAAFSGRTV
jgi:uncharacterized protein (TIGR03086 family)